MAPGVRDKMVEVHPGPPGRHLSESSLEQKIIFYRSNYWDYTWAYTILQSQNAATAHL